MKTLVSSIVLALLTACSHPIEIEGEGDVSSSGGRLCTLEDFQGGLDNCSKNYVIGDYEETYAGEPRDGWIFDRWENYCASATNNECSFNIPASVVEQVPGLTVPPLRAVFSRYKLSGPVLPASEISLVLGGPTLADVGYERNEFFIEGAAQSYTPDLPLPTDGKLVVNPDPYTEDGLYKTRLVVVKPTDAADFNGSVIVEWLNVSSGADAPPDWIMAHNEFIRGGYAWIGVSAQAVGVNKLKSGGSAARYASLQHPGDSYAYDIFTHIGQSIQSDTATLFDELEIERVIAAGESQAAFYMVTYVDAIHPLADVYDGYMIHSRFGSGAAISQSPLPTHSFPHPAPIRDDLNVPVMVVMAEGDVLISNLEVRQPDTTMFRQWEIAGTAHADAYTISGLSDPGDGSGAVTMFEYLRTPSNPFGCDNGVNAGAHHWILQTAFRGLDTWVRTLQDPGLEASAPPTGTPLQVLSDTPVVFDTDAYGNALGGVRSPHVDVPLATLDSVNSGIFFCPLFGRTIPFSAAEVLALYPTKEDFTTQWTQSLNDLVTDGFLLQEDADELEAAPDTWDFPN